MNRLITYMKETRAEMDHVSWPTRKQAIIYTALVIAIAGVTSLFTAAFDYGFAQLLDFVVLQ